ncbi:MAG: RecQ family ATP-dependent DNA helicase [Rhodanobacteraceae bacterium]|nr:RecQ family ATP-dependent DNA helicase [Rhodanobacteraceae bacterium]
MTIDLQGQLAEHFGFDQFQPGQRAVIDCLLAGRSAAAVFPTGGGKSLCYQLPALLLPGVTLVVSPLIALMKDQIDALARRGIAARRLDSSLDAQAYREVMSQLRMGSLRLLYVAPERFNNERFRAAMASVRISLFAIDEAHCISEWGHNFRPDYLKLAGIARELKVERVLALTATATPPVLADICRVFEIESEDAVRTGFHRPNLQLLTAVVDAPERDARLIDALTRRPAGPGIVYVTRQQTAETLSAKLVAAGLPARAYHAGLDAPERSDVQEWFLASSTALVVATIAFGMGIDKADIRHVYHYNPPKSLENYAQEIGRAGRDGLPSVCQIFYCSDDLNVLENFVYGDTPDANAVVALVDFLFSSGEAFDLALYETANRFDIRPLVLRTLLTYLELDGYLAEGTPFYADYSFQPMVSSADILSRFEGERRQFLARLLAQASKRRTWFSINLEDSARQLGCARERIVKALDWLGEQQLLKVEVAGVRNCFRRLREPDNLAALAAELHCRMLKREGAELARLAQVLALIGSPACRSRQLSAHFGETLAHDCGNCSACLGESQPLPQRTARTIEDELATRLAPLLKSAGKTLGNPRSLTRFLCGCSSPALTRARLAKHALFGVLYEVPFAQVLEWSHALLTDAGRQARAQLSTEPEDVPAAAD